LGTLAFWASTVIWISYSCLGREPNSFVFCFGSTKGNRDHSTFSREIRYKCRCWRARHFPGNGNNSFKMWCGDGDLNPHEIAPASTSSQKRLYRGVSSIPESLILLRWLFRPVSPVIRNHFNSTTVIPRQIAGTAQFFGVHDIVLPDLDACCASVDVGAVSGDILNPMCASSVQRRRGTTEPTRQQRPRWRTRT
jgi:hypothetical protein